jgi:hypothetical protein
MLYPFFWVIVWHLPSHGSLQHAPYLFHIPACGLLVGCYPPQSVSLLGPAPTLSPSIILAQVIFKQNLFPYKYPNILKPSHSSHLPAYEDGTDSVPECQHIKFRNWGITQKKADNKHCSVQEYVWTKMRMTEQVFAYIIHNEWRQQWILCLQFLCLGCDALYFCT